MDLITTKEIYQAIHQMDEDGQYIPFSISFFTCNQEKQTGGDFIHIDRAIRCGLVHTNKKHLIGIRPMDNEKYSHDITVHAPLIFEFNGKRATF